MSNHHGLILPNEPQYEHRASGYIIMDDGNGPIETAATMQCAHCGAHWISIKGSGKIRGFCTRCHGVFCGRQCAECVPFEKRLDDFEKGKRLTL